MLFKETYLIKYDKRQSLKNVYTENMFSEEIKETVTEIYFHCHQDGAEKEKYHTYHIPSHSRFHHIENAERDYRQNDTEPIDDIIFKYYFFYSFLKYGIPDTYRITYDRIYPKP